MEGQVKGYKKMKTNEKMQGIENDLEPTRVLFGAMVFDSEYQKSQIKNVEKTTQNAIY